MRRSLAPSAHPNPNPNPNPNANREQLGAFSLHFWVNYVDLGRSFPPACQGRAPEDPDCGIRLKSTPQELRDRLHAPALLARAAEEVRAFTSRPQAEQVRASVQRQRQPDDAGPESEADPASRRPRIACWVRQPQP